MYAPCADSECLLQRPLEPGLFFLKLNAHEGIYRWRNQNNGRPKNKPVEKTISFRSARVSAWSDPPAGLSLASIFWGRCKCHTPSISRSAAIAGDMLTLWTGDSRGQRDDRDGLTSIAIPTHLRRSLCTGATGSPPGVTVCAKSVRGTTGGGVTLSRQSGKIRGRGGCQCRGCRRSYCPADQGHPGTPPSDPSCSARLTIILAIYGLTPANASVGDTATMKT